MDGGNEGRTEGRGEGRKRGRKEGWKEGRQEGYNPHACLRGCRVMLSARAKQIGKDGNFP